MESVRRARKAGSWYCGSPETLNEQLTTWLQSAGSARFGPAKAIISPHAGYDYSGPCAGHAYREIDPSSTRKIFILGPSHYVRLDSIALSQAKIYQTPLGDLKIDQEIYRELKETRMFKEMSLRTDEEEHSIELQLPYIKKVMENCPHEYTIVPMMVGGIREDKERAYGKILAKYLAMPGVVFVISSDFCHWGHRFDYQHYEKSWGKIWQSIERLDKLGMQAIKTLQVQPFADYLRRYGNTICGRHPIGVMLGAIEHLNELGQQQSSSSVYNIMFHKYAQSSKCKHMSDSSVSYVAASVKQVTSTTSLTGVEPISDIADDLPPTVDAR